MGIFNALVVDPDLEWEFIDGSIVKAHQHSSGAACEQETAIGNLSPGTPVKFIWPLMPVVFLFISQ